ncbi:hypothetical protein BDY24DRAFT_442251 [Mrakia frigida]|uniref:uncharacterized protein n=1 Tax=Mrakia frigida TaxID=29902 RepID=UPI003FCC1A0F
MDTSEQSSYRPAVVWTVVGFIFLVCAVAILKRSHLPPLKDQQTGRLEAGSRFRPSSSRSIPPDNEQVDSPPCLLPISIRPVPFLNMQEHTSNSSKHGRRSREDDSTNVERRMGSRERVGGDQDSSANVRDSWTDRSTSL